MDSLVFKTTVKVKVKNRSDNGQSTYHRKVIMDTQLIKAKNYSNNNGHSDFKN